MWSGSFDGQPSGMAIFEATDEEANKFYEEYSNACENVLTHYLYQWDAMPILSVLSKWLKELLIFCRINMKNESCRICGCKIDEHTKCKRCSLITATICICCKKIDKIQTHLHFD